MSLSKHLWTAAHNTAPVTLLAQSRFIIRNPRQVTNTLYHLWYISALIPRWKNRKTQSRQTDGCARQQLSLQTHHRTSLRKTDRWNVATQHDKQNWKLQTCCWTGACYDTFLFMANLNKTQHNIIICVFSSNVVDVIFYIITRSVKYF